MPFETECHHCNRTFKLKDELQGKKFKCSDCGSVVVAEAILPAIPVEPPPVPETQKPKSRRSSSASASKPSRRRSVGSNSADQPRRRSTPTRSAKPPAPKKRRKTRSQDDDLFSGGGAYDEYDDYSNDFGDLDEANPYADNYGGNTAPRRSSKKRGRGKSGSRKQQQGGLNIGFNVNRLNLAMAGIALAIGFYAVSESRLAAKTKAEPTTISMGELIANGVPDNIYLTVTNVSAEVEEYVYEYRGTDESKYTKVFIPCRVRGQNNQRVGMVLMSSSLNSDREVSPLGFQRQFTGMIINEIRSLDREEKNLLNSIPGMNQQSPLIFELNRKPSSTGSLAALFGLSGVMLTGGLGWMFLTGTPDAAPVRSSSSRSSSKSRRSTSQRFQGRTAAPLSTMDMMFSFEGRVNRMQYFLTNLVTLIGFFIFLIILSSVLPEQVSAVIGMIGVVFIAFTSFAMAAKRAHDMNYGGWMNLLLLVPLVNAIWGIVLQFSPGNDGPNDFGPPPV